MKLRDFVGESNIRFHMRGKETLPVWDEELDDAEVAKLRDEVYLKTLRSAHREIQAEMTARHGNSRYKPELLAERLGVPVTHAFAFFGLHGTAAGRGLY